LIASGDLRGSLRVLDGKSGVELSSYSLPGQSLLYITFSPAGNRILAINGAREKGAGESEVRVFDLEQRKALWIVPRRPAFEERAAFSPDGTVIAFMSGRTVDYRDAATGRPLPTGLYQGSSAFAPLATAFFPWNPTTIRLLDSLRFGAGGANSAAFSPDGRTVTSNGGPTVLHFWDLQSQRDRLDMPGALLEQVDSVLVTPNGKTLISGGSDKTVRLWDLTSGQQRQVMAHPGGLRTMSLSHDGRFLVTGTEMRC
jgi:WD40 repeat protein